MWFYYVSIILGLSTIIISIVFLIQNQIIRSDFGLNLLSESWGILVTLLLLTIIIELRESYRWKPLRDKILKKIGVNFRNLFLDIMALVKTSKDNTIPTKREELADKVNLMISKRLQEWVNKEELELSERGEHALTDRSLINVYLTSFREIKQSLNDSSIYSDILKEPQIDESIMDIQKYLDLLMVLIRDEALWKQEGEKREWYFNKVLETIHRIIKEIYNLDKLGIDIYL